MHRVSSVAGYEYELVHRVVLFEKVRPIPHSHLYILTSCFAFIKRCADVSKRRPLLIGYAVGDLVKLELGFGRLEHS